MNHVSFDTLTRLAGGGTRRQALLRVAAAAFAGVGLAAQPGISEAGCKKVDQNCDRNRDCCDHARCRKGKCRCRPGFTNCDKKCKDLNEDENHCGACDAACPDGNACCDGTCIANIDQNEQHCGACGNACAGLLECVSGTCVLPTIGCAPGANSCSASGVDACGAGDCRCQQSTEGATVCVKSVNPDAECGQCTSSEQCRLLGENAVCVRTGFTLCCSGRGANFCAERCPPPA